MSPTNPFTDIDNENMDYLQTYCVGYIRFGLFVQTMYYPLGADVKKEEIWAAGCSRRVADPIMMLMIMIIIMIMIMTIMMTWAAACSRRVVKRANNFSEFQGWRGIVMSASNFTSF